MNLTQARLVARSPLKRKRAKVARPFKSPSKSTYSGRVAIRFRSLRMKNGWKVEEMWQQLQAAGIDVTVSAIRSWESGARAIDPNHYPALANIFGFSTVHEFLPPK